MDECGTATYVHSMYTAIHQLHFTAAKHQSPIQKEQLIMHRTCCQNVAKHTDQFNGNNFFLWPVAILWLKKTQGNASSTVGKPIIMILLLLRCTRVRMSVCHLGIFLGRSIHVKMLRHKKNKINTSSQGHYFHTFHTIQLSFLFCGLVINPPSW